MFTGIVRALGTVRSIQPGSTSRRLALDAPDLTRPLAHGASISVSGVCLTVVDSDETRVSFDVIPETLSRSTLGTLSPGDKVNLEPSLRAGDPLDGHMVQGHVDGVARVRRVRAGRDGHVVTCEVDPELMRYVVPKGSIALDGVSLTIAAVGERTFDVALIPETLAVTTLGELRGGERLNVETDILARTIVTTMERWRESRERNTITLDMLQEQGF